MCPRCLKVIAIGLCATCAIAAALPADQVHRFDRVAMAPVELQIHPDHSHPEPAPTEYLGPPAYSVQPSTDAIRMPRPVSVILARTDPRFRAALSTALGSPLALLSSSSS